MGTVRQAAQVIIARRCGLGYPLLSTWSQSRRRLVCAGLAGLFSFALPALGQGKTLGYVQGQVFSSTGPVADATVTAWHVDTSRTRTAVSGADGRYRFSGLAVGRYAVTAVVGNWQTSTVLAEVNVGEGTVVDLRVEGPRSVEEVVVVRESLPPVDATSSETTRIVTAGDIERLPITRDPNAVVLMAPGAVYGDTAFGTGRRREHYGSGYGYASLGGASVAENVYYINGMNVTNFRNGLVTSVRASRRRCSGARASTISRTSPRGTPAARSPSTPGRAAAACSAAGPAS